MEKRSRLQRVPKRLDSESATEAAYRIVREEILTNRLRPGDPFGVEQWVKKLGLSRTPVREALLQLSREGLIEIRPRQGTFVAPLDLRQIREMYEVRRELEGFAARLAAGLAPLSELRQLRDELLGIPVVEEGCDLRALSQAGRLVHEIIVTHCGNYTLQRMILSLQDHFARFRNLSLDIPEKVLSSHQEHIAIVDALLDRDGARAEDLVHSHFTHASRYLLESLLSGSSAGGRVTVALAAR